jgi:glycosyltransferase involved in cell wall biosynthesis
MRVDQWTPALHRGDAIGDSTLLMRDAFRRWGHEADVYSLTVEEGLEEEVRPWSDWRPGGASDVVILHYALPSPLTAALAEETSRRVLIHHNVTPPEFYAPWDPEVAYICALARAQLPGLAPHVDLALGDSEFNRLELAAAGFRRTGVLPISIDFERYRRPPSPVLGEALDDGRINALFVGRVAPNKKHEDLIRLASFWKRFVSPDLRLLLVGRLPRRVSGHGEPVPRHYFDALQALFYEEGLTPEDVVFLGHVQDDDLLACYRGARLFVSMSEHEGFGVPLVESMLMDVPVLAYASTAVPFTLGGAGVQFAEKDLAAVAELASALVRDASLRKKVLEGQRRRLAAFAPETVERMLKDHLESL